MKRYLTTLLLSLAIAPGSTGRCGELIDRIAAIVGTEVVTSSEVNTVKEIILKDPTGPAKEIPLDQRDAWARDKALQTLIDQVLLQRELTKHPIEITAAEVNHALIGVLRQNQMTQAELQKELAAKQITLGQYKRQLTEQLRQYRFIQEVAGSKVRVTDEEVRRHYESNPKLKETPFNETAPAIRQSLESQKLQEELHLYLARARASTFVEIKLSSP